MRIKAKYLGEVKNFVVQNNEPTVVTVEELLEDRRSFLWDEVSIVISSNEVNVEWDNNTDDYTFYKVDKFNAAGYDIEDQNKNEDDTEIDIYDFIETEYVAVLKQN